MHSVADPLAAVQTIDQNRLVDLGNPDQSYLLAKIRSGHNGFTEDLALTVRAGIVNWAEAMKAEKSHHLHLLLRRTRRRLWSL